MGIFWFGVLHFAQNHSASAILQKQKKKRKKTKSIQVLGILPKKHSVSSSVHAAHCALKEQLYECLCDAALQHPLHRAWSQPAVPPWVRSSPRSLLSGARCPPAANIWEAEGGKTPPWGPSVGCICIPHPASLRAAGQAEWGRILLTHTTGKTVVSFRAQSCRYLGHNLRFGEVSRQLPSNCSGHRIRPRSARAT